MNLKTIASKENGTTLLLTMIFTGIATFVIASYLSFVMQRHQLVERSQYWNQCVPVAEAGLEESLMNLGCNGVSNLTAGGWSAGTNNYYMDRYLDSNNISFYHAVISGNYQTVTSTVEGRLYLPTYISTGYVSRTVQIVATNVPLFDHGLVGISTIDFNNQNVSMGCGSGSGGSTNGTVNVNLVAQVALLNILNICLVGNVELGPQGAAVGANTQITGLLNVNAGTDVNVQFNSVVLPALSTLPPLANVNYNGQLYTYACSGDTIMNNINLTGNQSILVRGNTRLYVPGNVNLQDNAFIYVAPGSTLQMYVAGAVSSICGKGVILSDPNPLNFIYYGLDSNTSVVFNGPSSLESLIYAPKAEVDVGSSTLVGGILGIGATLDLSLNGAIIANKIKFLTQTEFTYCQSALTNGPSRGYVVNTWKEL